MTVLFFRNCKRKEHTVYVASSPTSSYLSAFSRVTLCKSPSIEAVAMHKYWLLQVCVTSLFLYLCMLTAWACVQCAKMYFFYRLLHLTQRFSFLNTFVDSFFSPSYMSIAKEPRMLIPQGHEWQCFRETKKKKRHFKCFVEKLFFFFLWVVYFSSAF